MLKHRSRAGILRARRGAPPRTTPDYPHKQLTQSGTDALRERLRERAGALPGVVQGWGEVHIDAETRRGSPIFMMVYAPRDDDELEAVWRIFRSSYEFALGLL